MIFQKAGSDEAVEVLSSPKRSKFTLDAAQLRLIRARTAATFKQAGISLAQIARILNTSVTTVSGDLTYLRKLAPGEALVRLPGVDDGPGGEE